jgi:repressor LexA
MTNDSKKHSSLSPRQLELLEYIQETCHNEHRMPSYREMAKALDVSAVGTIQDHVNVLVEKGHLVKDGRNLKLTENRSSPMLSVPIVGEVAAGSLQDAYEVALGTIAVSPHLLDRKAAANDFFALRVKGESMVDAGIYHGDYVVVRKNVRPKTGDFVVADVNGEATVKELKLPSGGENRVTLIPHNTSLKPILVDADENFKILGRVVAVQRYFN